MQQRVIYYYPHLDNMGHWWIAMASEFVGTTLKCEIYVVVVVLVVFRFARWSICDFYWLICDFCWLICEIDDDYLKKWMGWVVEC